MRRLLCFLLLLIPVLSACTTSGTTQALPSPTASTSTPNSPSSTPSPLVEASIPGLRLPAGFQISAYARDLEQPRFMTQGPGNTLLVANRGANAVVALVPGSDPTKAARSQTVVQGLHDPTSLDMHNGYLYIGENTSIARVKLDADLHAGPVERIISLPGGGQHITRTVLIGPDERIYVGIGSTCNVCEEDDPHRAAVWVYNLDGSQGRLFAKGLRNAVGLAINPWNQQIWATNNGRDLLGDNTPPETVYHLMDQGDYGWPHCHAGTIPDPEFGQSADACQGVQQPLVKMQAHSAPLGLAFPPPEQKQFPTAYRDSLYIAFHGSWNRSTPTGYKVVRVPLNNGQVAGAAEDFLTGFLQDNGSVTGRPAGVVFAADGTLFVSDDAHGTIYHIWYKG
ncbi:MAG TPA: PQQ-dependent sugar dehydrogenase [Ktedonobacteraceae bacterium]|nr:PQQ-dependent sugar dehydrogenase [Ktedonobacteraceae bacterium]